MKAHKASVNKIVIALIVTFVAVFSLYILYSQRFIVLTFIEYQKVKGSRTKLLCKTDHEVLLEACRELSKQVTTGDIKPGMYYIQSNNNPDIVEFPQPILDLKPSYIFIHEDGRVAVEKTFGRLGRFGVHAYPEDYKKPHSALEFGDNRELIDGLWYYDDGYYNNPDYDKGIDKIIQKGKK